jgi:hypothetical protein
MRIKRFLPPSFRQVAENFTDAGQGRPVAYRLMTKRVGVALRGQRGTLRAMQGPGQYMLWEIAR